MARHVVEAAVKQGIEVDVIYRENELELIVWNGSKVHYAGNEKDTLHNHKMEGDMRAYTCSRAPALISSKSEQGEYYIKCLRLKGVKI